MKFRYTNTSGRDITAFTSVFVFKDLLDTEINQTRLTYDDGIPAGESVIWDGQMNYSDYDSKDVTLRNKVLSKLKSSWEAQKILFVDGEKVEL